MNEFEKVLEKFNFEKVRACMVLANWTWFDPNTGEQSIPTIERMKEVCKALYYYASQSNVGSSSTGGFTVTVKKEYVNICFILESETGYYE